MPTAERTQTADVTDEGAGLPMVGDVIVYRLSDADLDTLQGTSSSAAFVTGPASGGVMNPYASLGIVAGSVVPALVTRVLAPGVVNAQVLPDCPGRLWVGSRTQGPGFGQWEHRP